LLSTDLLQNVFKGIDSNVRHKPPKLKVPDWRPIAQYMRGTEAEEKWLGKMPDKQLAAKLGRTEEVIKLRGGKYNCVVAHQAFGINSQRWAPMHGKIFDA
jgi:hypothetical protein